VCFILVNCMIGRKLLLTNLWLSHLILVRRHMCNCLPLVVLMKCHMSNLLFLCWWNVFVFLLPLLCVSESGSGHTLILASSGIQELILYNSRDNRVEKLFHKQADWLLAKNYVESLASICWLKSHCSKRPLKLQEKETMNRDFLIFYFCFLFFMYVKLRI
jgi:hypothetical protein